MRPRGIVDPGEGRNVERRGCAGLMVVDHDGAVLLSDRPCTYASPRRECRVVGNVNALTVAVELPRVEWTPDRIADHAAVNPQVRTQMRAVRVEYADPPIMPAKRHEVAPEIAQRDCLPYGEFARPGHRVPAIWIR